MSLAIITPSYIHSESRADFASKSLKSLRAAIGPNYQHIVVDDYPRCKAFYKRWAIDPKYSKIAEKIYNLPNTTLIRRRGKSSSLATFDALQQAEQQGAEFVFIHLDDNVYVPILGKLIKHALHAFAQDSALMKVRFAGHPVLWGECTTEQGNQTSLQISNDTVSYDRIRLQPTRYEDFTLWWTKMDETHCGKRTYPIVLWSVIYRTEFLKAILSYRSSFKNGSLANVERYYLKPENWQRTLTRLSGKLGYINMQYGGIEMEHNKNWRDLIQVSNSPVL